MDGYVSGGGRNVLAWNPESNSMQLKNAELTEGGVTYKLYMASFSWGDGFVHVGGGLVYKPPEVSYLSEVFKKYDSIGDSFSTDKSLLIGKAWQYGCVLNSEIGLLAGGATYTGADGFDWGNYQGDKTTQAYSRSSDSWANRTDVPERTFYGGNFAINGRGYLVEGLKTWNDIVDGELVYNYQATGASYSYDYDADSWDSIPNPHGDWWTLNSWGGSDGKGWVAEGSAKTAITGGDLLTNEGLGDEHYTTRAHFSFDPVLKTWSAEKRGSVSLGSARGDLSSTKKGASPINVKLGSGGSSYSGKYFKVDSNAWISTISSWSVARTMGSTAGGVGN
jgi:hypothetical protein